MSRSKRPFIRAAATFVLIVAAALLVPASRWLLHKETTNTRVEYGSQRNPRRSLQGAGLTVWWDAVPERVRQGSIDTGSYSNVKLADYMGPESCKRCHEDNYAAWSKHPHRWMNALADATTVKGDFSGEATIDYLGGQGTFYQKGNGYRMRLVRDEIQRTYEVNQTIGSRFFQYYVGRQLEGPEPSDHVIYKVDHVLPFGYWLNAREWVPTVHVNRGELPDSDRGDPFSASEVVQYAHGCSFCHTTRPIGDWILRKSGKTGLLSPRPLSFFMAGYLAESHPELLPPEVRPTEVPREGILDLHEQLNQLDAREHAATLGISCESCHNGGKEHVADMDVLPRFFPSSPHLFVQGEDDETVFGPTSENVNWICGRCHTGSRSQFARGMATWNSTEYSDAMRGSCYSELTCLHCHDPHQPTGQKWPLTPAQDDALCLECHQKYEPPEARLAHTHHLLSSDGSRCMNCHMPRLNEGLEDVVRTHTIFSPTEPEMIEANQPNACNQCHLDEPIDWTINYLNQWYGAQFSGRAIAENYRQRTGPVGLGWLESPHGPTRLVAADALARANATWALPVLLEVLDDAYLINRQFAQKWLEEMLGIELKQFGYRFYMTQSERREPLARIRQQITGKGQSTLINSE